MPEIIPSITEEQEEEEEKYAATSLPPRGMRSRGPAVLAKVEPAGYSDMAEGIVVAEQSVVERAEVEISSQPGDSTQVEASSAQERVEVRQSGSPSVLMPTS